MSPSQPSRLESLLRWPHARPKTALAVTAILLATQIGPWWYATKDSSSYLSIARSVAHGRGLTNLGSPHLWFAPGYSVILSPLFLVSDRPLLAISIVGWLLAVAYMAGVYVWARRAVPPAAIWIAMLSVLNTLLWVNLRRPLSEAAFVCGCLWTVNALHAAAHEPAHRRRRDGNVRCQTVCEHGAHAAGRRCRAKCSGVHACGVR